MSHADFLLRIIQRVVVLYGSTSCLELAQLEASKLTKSAIDSAHIMHITERLGCCSICEVYRLTLVLLLR